VSTARSLTRAQTVVGSKRLLNNANWARYNLAVSVRKENEPSSSSMFNMNLPGKPVVVRIRKFPLHGRVF
jgi:hypothetical protein